MYKTMKKYTTLSLLLLAFMMMITAHAQGQQYGYMNSAHLMSRMPEVQSADTELAAFQKELAAQLQIRADDFQNRLQVFSQSMSNKALTSIEYTTQEAAFQKEQMELRQLESTMMEQVQAKREELLQPILEKVDRAIREVAREQGYQLIFDTSLINTVLSADESLDVEPLVADRLGL
jgi:outer membrane protein